MKPTDPITRSQPLYGRRDPDARGYFGAYGGRFVPETLVAPIEELTAGYLDARQDGAFTEDFNRLLVDYVGRPTPLYETRRLAPTPGQVRLLLKREDLTHTGAHKNQQRARSGVAGPAHGEAPRGRRDRRRTARRGHGHGLRATRSRMPGVHGHRGHAAPGAQRRAHGTTRRHRARCRGGQLHAQRRDQRGLCATGLPTSPTRTTCSVRC